MAPTPTMVADALDVADPFDLDVRMLDLPVDVGSGLVAGSDTNVCYSLRHCPPGTQTFLCTATSCGSGQPC